MHIRLVSFLATILFVGVFGLAISYLARGYRLDTKNIGLKPTGLLVATSSPDGAQIFVNGQLESATNATITLPPDTYDVEIRKDSYLSWRKRLTIKKEEVTKVDATLFPAAPSLSALTFGGAINPIPSRDGSKVIFGMPGNGNTETSKVGLWVMDLGNLPIGFSGDPRQVTNLSPENATWSWSPDSRQVLVTTPSGTYLISSGTYTADSSLVNSKGARLDKVLAEWKKEEALRLEDDLDQLSKDMRDFIERKAQDYVFSPDNTKVLYIASASATLKDELIPPLPGSSTQKQERSIKPQNSYIYDIKEDRNFYITDQKASLSIGKWEMDNGKFDSVVSWFPNSLNIVLAEKDKVTIADYDGTNQQAVWQGPYVAPYAIPAPNGQRLLLLTPLGTGSPNFPNIYALGLK